MRIRLIVFEEDIEARLVLLDEVRLENQGLDLVVHDDELEIRDQPDQLSRLRIVITARLKIRPDAVAKVLCFADIQDLAGLIPVNVDTGICRQRFEFFRDGHIFIICP